MYAPRVYRYLRARVREPHDAEDLLQATYLRVVEALPRWESRGVPFAAWLFRIARNAAIDHARTRRTLLGLDHAAAAVAPGADPAESLPSDLGWRVLDAMRGLTPDQRDVLALRYFGDLTGPEIARTLGKEPAAVRALQVRAMDALRRAMAREREVAPGALRMRPREARA